MIRTMKIPKHDDETRTFRLLQLTDPHLCGKPAAEIHGVNTSDSFERTLRHAFADGAPPDAILVTGDIGDDLSEAAYARFRATLLATGTPAYCLPGNHDTPATMERLLPGENIHFGGRARLGAWGLILLDSHEPDAIHGKLSPAAFERLDADLHALRDRPVLLAVHHPPMPVGSPWIDVLGLRNGAELLARLDRFPNVRAIVSGHVHQAFDTHRGALRLLTTPSTCAQFAPNRLDCVIDSRPPGYRWLLLSPEGRLDTEVRWLEGWVPNGPVVNSRASEP